MMEIDATKRIGEELRALRLSRGLTLRELAAISGIVNNRIYSIEKGLNSPSVKTLSTLCAALGAELHIAKLEE